jgi:hypothetical protein
MTAYIYGARAFLRGKHLQANPFDYMTEGWKEWRNGYISAVQRPAWTSYDYNSAR